MILKKYQIIANFVGIILIISKAKFLYLIYFNEAKTYLIAAIIGMISFLILKNC